VRDGEGEVGRESEPDGDAAMAILYCTRASGLGMEIVPTVAFLVGVGHGDNCRSFIRRQWRISSTSTFCFATSPSIDP
jgi:hypothetical protein